MGAGNQQSGFEVLAIDPVAHYRFLPRRGILELSNWMTSLGFHAPS